MRPTLQRTIGKTISKMIYNSAMITFDPKAGFEGIVLLMEKSTKETILLQGYLLCLFNTEMITDLNMEQILNLEKEMRESAEKKVQPVLEKIEKQVKSILDLRYVSKGGTDESNS